MSKVTVLLFLALFNFRV